MATLTVAMSFALGAAGPAYAAQTITVDATSDGVDPTPPNGTCGTGAGTCTLRAAIQTANQDPGGGDTIVVPAAISPYTLSLPGATEEAAASGDLDVTQSMTITGAGAATTIVDGADLDRVFDLRGGTVTISGLTIRNGAVGASQFGGGVRTVLTTNATLNDSTVTGNDSGGSGAGVESQDNATLTLNRVTVSNNAGVGGTNGGTCTVAEENGSPSSGGLFVNDSTISSNSARFGGGGCEEGGGRLDVVNSVVRDNFLVPGDIVPEAGGLVEDGSGVLNVIGSTVSGNTASDGGGVVEDGGGVVTITNSTVANNHAVIASSAGTMFADSNGSGGGLVEDGGGTVTISGSTFSGNTAANNGGAMMFQGESTPSSLGGPISITNSTITGNTAGPGGGGIRIDLRTQLTLTNTTVSGNSAAAGGDLNICVGGPPVHSPFTCHGAMTLRNTIVSGGGASNCATSNGTISSAGHNLDSGTTCGFGASGDKTGADPKLNALASNGGPTQTQALQDGSPAIDSADSCPATDQRGFSRPFGPACDMGAFEGGVPAPVVPPVNNPPAQKPSPDIAIAGRAACLSIPGVVRDQKANAPGGGKLVLQTRQVDDPAHPLRASVKGTGGARVKSVTIKVNGRVSAGSVPQNLLRLGSKAKRNKVTAAVVLKNGKKVTLTQFLIVLKCSTPATTCARLADGKSMRCTSRTPLGGRKVKVTVSRTTTEVATGTATVKKGKYAAIVRSKVALSAGTYAYKHVVSTATPRQRYYMIRKVSVT